jgi:hypothetical protein
MGTRGLLGWKLDGVYHGLYNHWDSYPESLGMDAAYWVHTNLTCEDKVEAFKANLCKLNFIDKDIKPPVELQKRYEKFSDLTVSSQEISDWYCLLRKLQGVGYFSAILSGELEHVPDEISFIKDSLFCEHAYFLNLDDNTFDYFKGFQKKPVENDPFAYLPDFTRVSQLFGDDVVYYSCALVWSCPIQDVLTRMEKYIKETDTIKWLTR